MTNLDFSFEDWFKVLHINVLEKTGVNFTDADSFIDVYNSHADVYDVIKDIVDEYAS